MAGIVGLELVGTPRIARISKVYVYKVYNTGEKIVPSRNAAK